MKDIKTMPGNALHLAALLVWCTTVTSQKTTLSRSVVPSPTPEVQVSSENNNLTGGFGCVSLNSSQLCQSWSAGFVNISSTWTVPTFDTSLRIWADSPQHVSDFNNVYGCNWDGHGLRYVFTYGCAERLYGSDVACNLDFKNQSSSQFIVSGTQLDPTMVQPNLARICYKTCMAYRESLLNVLNSQACPNNVNEQQISSRKNTLDYIASFCSMAGLNSTCVDAVPNEADTCGYAFNVEPDGRIYCRQSNPSDPCCQKIALIQASNELIRNRAIMIGSITGSTTFVLMLAGVLFVYLRRRDSARFSISAETLYSSSSGSIKTKFSSDSGSEHTKYRPRSTASTTSLEIVSGPSPKPHVAIHPYVPQLEDEIELVVGDDIYIQEIYNDGWVNGINSTQKTQGTFPAACISPKDDEEEAED